MHVLPRIDNLIHVLSIRYGGGPELTRTVIAEGVANKTVARVEVYPLRLKILNTKTDGTLNLASEMEVEISKKATVADLKGMYDCNLFDCNL